MNLNKIKYFYFLGIGGIGMSALARYFKAMGKNVSGYDKTPTKLTDEMISEGIPIHFEENVDFILPDVRRPTPDVLIVCTPAVPKEHSELVYFQKNNFIIKKRSEVLGMITEHTFTIAVAGTHGKTTTSSMIAHILKSSGVDCSAFLGGITQNYNTNLLLSKNIQLDKQTKVVVEADEYDRSFLTLHPDIAIITSIDADHLDIYGDKKNMHESYNLFAKQVKSGGTLIAKKGTEEILEGVSAGIISYSQNAGTNFKAENVEIINGAYHYSIVSPQDKIENIVLGIPGMHNVENSVAAAAAARMAGVDDENIRKALASFRGVKRRFEYHIKRNDFIFIDDYAHHPAELRACISAVKELYKRKKVTGIFQPHLYTRTRDFADEFAESLSLLDELILLDIYPAREKPIEGITSAMLLNKVRLKTKMLCTKKELIEKLKLHKLEVLLTLGAGDIDTLVEPIAKAFAK